MMYEILVVYCLAFFDIGITYYLLYKLKASGEKKWYMAEQNKLVQGLLKKFGLHNGIRASFVITFAMLTGLMYYFTIRGISQYDLSRLTFFMMGVYTIILSYHMLFLKQAQIDSKKRRR